MVAQLARDIASSEATMIHLYTQRVTVKVPFDKRLTGTIGTEKNHNHKPTVPRLMTAHMCHAALKIFLLYSGT